MQSVKSVMVGSSHVGKTSFIIRYAENNFITNPPMCFDNFAREVTVSGRRINVGLWDTASTAEYSRLRPLSYPPTDVFLIFFSLVDPATLWDVSDLWYPEISHHCPNTPLVLIGTKKELRDTRRDNIVTTEQGMAIAISVGAAVYLECSSATGENVELAMEQMILCVIGHHTASKQKRCNIQ